VKLYRGMTLAQWTSGDGLSRRGNETEEQLYAGDTHVGAGDPFIHVGAPCEGNALSMHTIDSKIYKLAFLSFTLSFDVAAYYALQRRMGIDHEAIVVQTSVDHLSKFGIRTVINNQRVPWEQEVTLVMEGHATLPLKAVTNVHRIDMFQVRRSASKLYSAWPDITAPDFLRDVGF